MENLNSTMIIEKIYNACELLKDNHFEVAEGSEKNYEIFSELDEYFKTSGKETWILCALISEYLEKGETCSLEQLANFFNCKVLKFLINKPDLDSLLEKKYIREIASAGRRRRFSGNSIKEFAIERTLIDCILDGKEFKVEKTGEEDEKLDSVGFVRKITDMVGSGSYTGESLNRAIEDMENENSDLEFIQESKKIVSSREMRYFFYNVCGDFFVTDRGSSLLATVDDHYRPVRRIAVAKSFLEESNELFKAELVEFKTKGTLQDSKLVLTYKGKQVLLGENINLYVKNTEGTNMILPGKIKEKKLFYSPENEEQIERIKNSLTRGTFRKIQQRLEEQNLPKGVAILLYGAAGTGKTESVYQIAKKTGRSIYHVDIAASKSAWFGESEKIIKRIFDSYKEMCRQARKEKKLAPILLFNEADAIFKKRSEDTGHSTNQTLNAMQNIILEEMENFHGILIATTNLAKNFDSAFERRFLFKVKFERPTVDAKKSIWLSKLDWLDEKTAENFAENFDLSGGEIDNICRKITMDEIITGTRPDNDKIRDLCRTEKFEQEKSKNIGFLSMSA